MIDCVTQLPLEPGEHIEWRATANRTHEGTAVGGRLVVTDRRILFIPTGFEQGLGRDSWQCSFQGVLEVDLADREMSLFSGGLRRRVRIRTETSTELFVVWRPRRVADRLQQAVRGD